MPSLIVINLIVGLVGVAGFVGALLIIFIGGPVASAALFRIVSDILGSRTGLAIVIGAACLYGGLVYGDVSGRREEAAKCQAAQLAADAAAKARDAQQGQLAGADAASRLAQLEAAHQSDMEQIDALTKADGGACRPITPADLR